MTEPRMRLRQKGQQFSSQDLALFLTSFGDAHPPLPTTISTLDEITTDFIIETCHGAAAVAHHSRRQKIKLDDFKFMLRRDTGKLGRVSEMLELDRELKTKRKAFDTEEGVVGRGVEAGKEEGAGEVAVKEEGGGGERKRRKGRKKGEESEGRVKVEKGE